MIRIGLILMSILILAIPTRAEYEYPSEYKTSSAGLIKISIDCPQGSIRFEPAADNDITVNVMRIIHHNEKEKAEKLAKECKTDIYKDGQTLIVKVEIPPGNSHARNIIGSLFSGDFKEELEILVKVSTPPELVIKVTTSSADITANDLKNDISIRGSSSDINLENIIGDCDLQVSSGDLTAFVIDGNLSLLGSSSDIQVEENRGDLRVSTASGDVMISRVTGRAKIETTSGDLRIYGIDGSVDLQTTSGDILAENLSGSAKVTSTSGDIRLLGLNDPAGDFYVDATSGDVVLEVTREFSGRLEMETDSGNISADLDMTSNSSSDTHLQGMIGNGNGRINVVTISGDITLSKM
jgi:DUF4097 and DUF4098 domain-containing protein YvlB